MWRATTCAYFRQFDIANDTVEGKIDAFINAGVQNRRGDLENAVGKILKVSDPLKVTSATEVFIGCLDAGTTAADTSAYIDTLSAT